MEVQIPAGEGAILRVKRGLPRTCPAASIVNASVSLTGL